MGRVKINFFYYVYLKNILKYVLNQKVNLYRDFILKEMYLNIYLNLFLKNSLLLISFIEEQKISEFIW